MTAFGKKLIQSAKEARAFARGEADVSNYRIRVPQEINIKELRTRIGMTQADFANRFGFPIATLRDWEQNRRKPDQSARVLLAVIDHDPDFVQSALVARLSVEQAPNTGKRKTRKTKSRDRNRPELRRRA
jgi:putative transcriptional regulator